MPDPSIQKITTSHFRIEEEFGTIKLGTNKYRIKKMDIYSRSLHRLVGKSLPMEIIFSAELLEHKKKVHEKSATSKRRSPLKLLKFSFFFEEAHIPYVELYTLGLGRDTLKYLPTKRKDPLHSGLDLHTTFNINKLVENYKKVVWYEARSIMDNCKPAIFMVLFDLLWIGQDQLTEFVNPIERALSTSGKLSSNIWANFLVTA